MEHKIQAMYFLSEQDMGSMFPMLMVSQAMVLNGIPFSESEKDMLHYGNITQPLKKGDKISNYMDAYIKSVDGGVHLRPQNQAYDYEETLENGVQFCVRIIMQGKARPASVDTLLERCDRWEQLGRPDEALGCLSLGYSTVGKHPDIKRRACLIELAHFDELLQDAAEMAAQLMAEDPTDMETIEVSIRVLNRYYQEGETYPFSLNGKVQELGKKEILTAMIDNYRARGGASKEVNAIEKQLSGKKESSFFGGWKA